MIVVILLFEERGELSIHYLLTLFEMRKVHVVMLCEKDT